MVYSIHANMVIVADGADEAAGKPGRVLRNDHVPGFIRHAHAGYDVAKDYAKKFNPDPEQRLSS